MRRAVSLIAATMAMLTAAPARAQTYDPAYPICVQVYGPNGYISCRYTSMEACRELASGRGGAQCIANPYFGSGKKGRYRRLQ